jgi:hypothetical protein
MITSNLDAPIAQSRVLQPRTAKSNAATVTQSSAQSSTQSSAQSGFLEPTEAPIVAPSQADADASGPPSKRRVALQEIVFIDGAVPRYSILATGVHLGIEVIMLDNKRDGIEQITHVLRKRKGLLSLHLVSLGAPGHIQLGNTALNLNTLERYGWDLAIWGTALAAEAELLIYGSEIAKGVRGEELLAHLSELIAVKVAASRTKTGSAAGGNWDLEINVGHCKTSLAFSPEAMARYDRLL